MDAVDGESRPGDSGPVDRSANPDGAPRLGAIDCGSNAIRMVIAEVGEDGELHRITAERVPVRLGRGAFTRGELDRDTVEQAVQAMARFRQVFDQHGVDRYRAVATSAVRSAGNRDTFLHRLYHEAGIELDVIDGAEEARLVRKAVMTAFAGHTPPRLVIDLGGGSLELNVREHDTWRPLSLPVGTVRLVETFGLTGAIGHEEAGMVRRYAVTLLHTVQPQPSGDLAPAAACGGNLEAMAALFGETGLDGMPGFDLEALELALPSILDLSVDERMARFGVRRDRAEVMGVAALVIATVCRALHIPRLSVPGVGIRDALLVELAESSRVQPSGVEDGQGKALLTAARTFAKKVGHDLAHGECVRR
ncbi:MAG: hypothetical protein AAGC55_06400, partial [Myxococcota bacterium]